MSDTTIKLGLMPPLTGLVGIYGPEIARAGLIACQEVNENGGVLGRPLELVIEDDGSLPESAVAAAENLVIRDGCSAIIGNLLSNSRIAVAYRVAEPRKVPYLNFSFYEGSIASRYFFHFAAIPNQQIDQMIPYMREKFGPRMFFAGNNYEWPRGSIHAGKVALDGVGGVVVGEEYYPLGVSAESIESLLDQVEKAGPDVFVPYFAGTDQLALLTKFTERGMKNKMAVVMGHYDEMMASNLSSEIREGFYSSNTYFMTVDTPGNKDFLARLSEYPGVSGVWPKGNGILTNFGEGAYICVKAFAEAANRAGSLDPDALVNALETIEIKSPQGTVQMNPAHHHARVNTYLSRCGADGVFNIVEKFDTIDPVLPERYSHQAIRQSTTLEEDLRLQARILELMSEAVFIVRMEDRKVAYANAGAERMFGHGVNELLGLPITKFCKAPLDAPETFFDDLFSLLVRKGDWQGEIRRIEKGNSGGICSLSVFVFTHPVFGEVWLFVATDITERKFAEIELKESEERFRTLVEATSSIVWEADPEGQFFELQQSWMDYTGQPWPDHQGYGWTKMIHPDDVEDIKRIWCHALEAKTNYLAEGKVWSVSHEEYRHFTVRAVPLFDDNGTVQKWAGTIVDTHERKVAEKATIDSEIRLKGILDIAPEAVIAIGKHFNIRLFNQGAERIFGYKSDEVIGKPLDMLMPKRYRKSHLQHVEMFNSSSETYKLMDQRQELFGLRKGGGEFPAAASVSKLEIAGETIYTVLLHDITDRKQAEKDIVSSKEEAEIANYSKTQFLANMSHELRTPLNSIIGYSQILMGLGLGELTFLQSSEYAKNINHSANHLLALIQDILDVSKVEAQELDLDIEPINLTQLIEDCFMMIRERADKGEVKLSCIIADETLTIDADEVRVKQVLLNLLSNAIKFTPAKGKIIVAVESRSKGGVCVKVSDTGIGIKKEDIPKILKPFGQVKDILTRNHEGTGLGLSLAKSLVELHNGNLEITSRLGKGTTVCVELPYGGA